MSDTATLTRAMNVFPEIVGLLVGLCIGSFLNVVIARLPEGISIVSPRSRCPRCQTPIAWYDNIPLLSWLFLLRRCRHCKAPISPRYPMVELLVGLLSMQIAREWGLTPLAGALLVFVSLLVAITYIDLDHWIIPWELSIPGILIGMAQSFINPRLGWTNSAIGAVAGFSVFALIAFLGRLAFKKEALGEGDWWLLAMIGAFLGWEALLPVILLASLQGSVIGIVLIVAGRAEQGVPPEKPAAASPGDAEASSPVTPPESQQVPPQAPPIGESEEEEEEWVPPRNAVPFGPFLALAALEQLFLGDVLRDWYDLLIHRLMG